MEKNILLTIAYDGSGFSGWQRQPGRLTVQGCIEEVLSRLCGRPVTVDGTSRTDAGVHAAGQRATFRTDLRIPVEKLPRVMNDSLASWEKSSFQISPVRILAAEEKPPGFHARFDATGKKYIYRIRDGGSYDVFRRNYFYQIKDELNVEAMRQAAKLLRGKMDFKSFEASGGTPRKTTVRTVYDIDVRAFREDCGRTIELHIKGDGFLYNMVRIMTGTIVEVGRGDRAPEEMRAIAEARDRRAAGHTAPPYGLCLAEVYYSGEQ